MWSLLIIATLLISLAIVIKKYIGIKKQFHFTQPFIHMVENAHDIIYTCRIKPKIEYVYLSKTLDSVIGHNQTKLHLQDPLLIRHFFHPDDLPKVEQKLAGEIDFRYPIE